MKRILRTALVLLLCLTLYLCLVPAAHAEELASGEWGSLHWTLDDAGLLTISGEGEMKNFSYNSTDAWHLYQKQIVEAVIAPGVTSIGNKAFQECVRLKSIMIPESVTSIDGAAFSGCKSLAGVSIPEGVTYIDGSAFSGCSSLTSVTIPESVTSIGDSAFYKCSSLISVIIPESVTNIDQFVFFGCSSLTSVIIPESVTRIGKQAFSYCRSLTSVTIPKSVTSIDLGAFYGCSSLTSVIIPESVANIGGGAFSRCTSLTGIWVSENNKAYCSDAYGVLFNKVKDKLINAPGMLSSTYIIPSSVTSIGSYAFSECSSLTGVMIPESVTNIGISAFSGCSSLTSVTIPESIVSIEQSAFENCDSLTSIIIPESVTSIGNSAFRDCDSLTSITIPGYVESMGSGVFSGCTNLINATISDGATSLGEVTFWYCSSLTSVTIPESVKFIDNSAFQGCDNLKDVYYAGTKAQWEAIFIDDGNDPLRKATIHYGTVPEMYTVTYDANGGTGAPSAQTKEAGFALTLSAAVPTRESSAAGSFEVKLNSNDGSGKVTVLRAARTNNYTFKGWNTAADGTKTAYAPGAKYTLDEDLTLYAQWDSTTTSAAVTLPTPTREGCIFKGWATSSSADSGITGSYTPSANVVLYAIWQKADFILPASLTTIEAEAFAGGAFAYVQLPEGAAVIRSRAFADCPNLAYIYIPEDTAVIAKDAFSGVDGLTILGRSDSYTEFYAQRNGYTFAAVD